jgi:excisionase family DNA binding protein
MNEPVKNPFDLLVDQIRAVVREEIAAVNRQDSRLLTPEQLAEKLSVPLSWVYEQSRQGNIPTHRIGKYIRFNLAEVVSQKKNGGSS